MARLFVTDINLNKNELQNARIQGLSSAPLNPVTGQIYYNTSENKMYYYNGLSSPNGPWVTMSGSDEVIQDVVAEAIVAGYGISKNYVDDPDGKLTLEIDTSETADLTTAQTLTNKTIGTTGLLFNDGSNNSSISSMGNDLSISANDTLSLSAGGDLNIQIVGDAKVNDDVIVTSTDIQTISNKTIEGLLSFKDSGNTTTGSIQAASGNITINSSAGIDLTPGGSGLAKVNSDVIVTEQATQTLTNKTLTSPNVSGLNITDSAITFEGSIVDGNHTTLQVTNPTADHEITLPDATGTVALLENKLHDFALATQSLDLNSQKITNLAEPTDPQDAATKYYVDAAVAGLTWKHAVNLASTTNVDISGDLIGTSIDGHAAFDLTDVGYRILLTGQTTVSENGIYVLVESAGTLVAQRSEDADAIGEIKGAAVFVSEGTNYGKTSWVQSNHYLTDFSGQSWEQFAGASDYTAGDGLTADGNVFNVGQGLGITVTANAVAIDTNVTARKYSAVIGNGTATSYIISHGLSNQFVVAQVYQNSAPYALVETDVELTSPTQITIRFAVAPTTDEYIVNIIG